MSDLFFQDEIDVFLWGMSEILLLFIIFDQDKDVLGEIGNILMGMVVIILSILLNQKVNIIMLIVSILKWEEFFKEFFVLYVVIKVVYKEGFDGVNFFIFKKEDVEIIVDFMMGGIGQIEFIEELIEFQFLVIQEVMNQMVGFVFILFFLMLNFKIDINLFEVFVIDFVQNVEEMIFEFKRVDEIVKVVF